MIVFVLNNITKIVKQVGIIRVRFKQSCAQLRHLQKISNLHRNTVKNKNEIAASTENIIMSVFSSSFNCILVMIKLNILF